MGTSALEIAAGAIIAIVITIWVEWLRKPRLLLRVTAPIDQEFDGGRPATDARFVSVGAKAQNQF
jgi:hypothetical protein